MNMNEFDSCVHRIIKRIYPVLAYEYEMGLTESRGEPSGIYSFQLLRSLHDNSLDNIHKILRQAESENDCKDKEFDKAEKKILLEFFTYLNEKKSQLTQSWLSLQHYMHYIYCSFTSGNPQLYDREISELYIAEMKNLVKILSEADKIQLYLRVFSILREYVTFAFWQYSKQIHKGVAIDRLHRSYQAFLIASNNIYPVFLDLEKILKDKCNMTWMDYNKFIFFNYFYEAIETEILMKIRLQEKLDVPEKYNSMIVDFGELNTLWQTLKNLRGINENMDKEMSDDHKQILKKVFWICRKETEEKQSLQRLAAELIILASERRLLGSEPLLDKHGQCLCEDCLIFKLSYIVEPGDGPDPNYIRVSPCRYCPEILELNKLHDHVVEHLKIIVANEDDDNSLNFMTLEKSIEVRSSKKNRDNREDCAEKMSQCLINLLKKNENLKEQDVESKPSNNRQDEKTIELVESKENIQKESVKLPLSSKNEVKYKNSSSCSHTCKHEEELKAELKKLHGVCDHHKDSKRCDCTYCEVFGTGVSTHIHKSSETRNRLRIRLNQRKQKILSKNAFSDKTNKVPPTVKNNPTAVKPKIEQSTTPSENEPPKESTPEVKPVLKSSDSFIKDLKIISETTKDPKIPPKPVEHDKLKDIPGLVDYIEGNSGTDKVAIAEKKAAKKARQRQKKEEERKQIEQEEKRNEVKDNDKETKNMKQLDKLTSNEVKNSKKQKNKETSNGDKLYDKTEKNKLIEETIPAMVTIKRSIENGNVKPTVTITLKGSTPDQDKLIYALVNGHDQNEEKNNQDKSKKNKKKQDSIDQKIEYYVKLQVHQKEKKGNSNNNNNINNNNNKSNSTVEKEVKVSFNDGNNVSFVNNKNSKDNNKKITQQVKIANDKKKELDLPFLKLPPGITVTKIDGSLSNKNQKPSEKEYDSSRINVPGNNKSGVIVVETEKLIQTTTGNKDTEINRKNKKKKNKKQNVTNSNPVNSQPMVTLKNPVFQSLSETVSKEPSLPYDIAGASFGQAYISKSENGMVTIRSSRLQQSFNNSVPSHHNLLSDLKPVISEDAGTSFLNNSSSTESTISSFNAQEILSGLPGIEITKVDKKNLKHDDAKDCQCAQVSIISTNGEKCNLDKDDWVYDNIFTPKDVLEDELDAEERELEAFKRFCQQSIPPKQKEKVAHLNVKDIVLKKKNDVN